MTVTPQIAETLHGSCSRCDDGRAPCVCPPVTVAAVQADFPGLEIDYFTCTEIRHSVTDMWQTARVDVLLAEDDHADGSVISDLESRVAELYAIIRKLSDRERDIEQAEDRGDTQVTPMLLSHRETWLMLRAVAVSQHQHRVRWLRIRDSSPDSKQAHDARFLYDAQIKLTGMLSDHLAAVAQITTAPLKIIR